jgi:hypothetical protein
MSLAGKAVVFWLAYGVLFSLVIGLAVGQAKPNKQIDIYQETIQ